MKLLVLGAIWGASFMLMRISVPEFGIWAMVEIRAVLASVILLPFVWWRRELKDMLTYWRQVAVVGLLNTAIPFCFFAYGAMHLPSALTALLNGTAGIFGALLAWLWLRETISTSAKFGFLFGVFGVFLLSYESLSLAGVSLLPVFSCLIATFCYGVAVCYFKRYLSDAKPLAVAAGSQIVTSIVLAPLVLMFPVTSMPSADAWGAVLILALVCTGIAYVLYFDLIGNIGASKAIYVGYVVPVFGLLWGWWLLDETISPIMLAGAGVILFGIGLTSGGFDKLKRKWQQQPS
jgi:drug/metabolite transporter (DMT)-like permease